MKKKKKKIRKQVHLRASLWANTLEPNNWQNKNPRSSARRSKKIAGQVDNLQKNDIKISKRLRFIDMSILSVLLDS